MESQAISLHRRHIIHAFILMGIFLCISFGGGYFWGRIEQIERNKSLLKTIPDVNCVSKSKEV